MVLFSSKYLESSWFKFIMIRLYLSLLGMYLINHFIPEYWTKSSLDNLKPESTKNQYHHRPAMILSKQRLLKQSTRHLKEIRRWYIALTVRWAWENGFSCSLVIHVKMISKSRITMQTGTKYLRLTLFWN